MNTRALLEQCDNPLPGHGPVLSLKETLASLVASMDGSEDADVYGGGSLIQGFEDELATLFGKEAAVFMPSGTMAQQIALRISCESQQNFSVAMHPSSHLETGEQFAYQYLHGLKRLQFGVPELIGHRPLERDDLASLGKLPGAILIELPYRPLGGRLPDWASMVAISAWARENRIPLHLDGARIWQCAPAYQRSLAEIAELFDSVYVSFYKDIGALCGAALLGSAPFIADARIWQHRHGGKLFTQAPFVVSARQRLADVLPQLPSWNARAREIAARLNAHSGAHPTPSPPDVNFFALYLAGEPAELTEKHNVLARETGTFLFGSLRPADVPGYSRTELHCVENALHADLDRLDEFLERLLG